MKSIFGCPQAGEQHLMTAQIQFLALRNQIPHMLLEGIGLELFEGSRDYFGEDGNVRLPDGTIKVAQQARVRLLPRRSPILVSRDDRVLNWLRCRADCLSRFAAAAFLRL